MSTSDDHRYGIGTDRQTVSRRFGTRYDLLLAVIPVVFLCGLVASVLLAAPVQFGLTAASMVSVGLIADGLFRNPPVEGGGR